MLACKLLDMAYSILSVESHLLFDSMVSQSDDVSHSRSQYIQYFLQQYRHFAT